MSSEFESEEEIVNWSNEAIAYAKSIFGDKPSMADEDEVADTMITFEAGMKIQADRLLKFCEDWCTVVTDPAEGYPNEGEYQTASTLRAALTTFIKGEGK